MRLSTFSSDAVTTTVQDRFGGKWLRTWLLTALLVLGFLGGWEALWRSKGFEPAAVNDTRDLWVRARERAALLGEKAVILVGASRVLLGINLAVLAEYTETHPVQLAIDGAPFVPVLDQLSRDERIKGTVIVSVAEHVLDPKLTNTRVQDWIDAYEKRRNSRDNVFYQPVEDRLRNMVDNWFSFRTIGARPLDVLMRWVVGEEPARRYVRVLRDRSFLVDYSLLDTSELYKRRLERHRGSGVTFRRIPDFQQHIQALEEMIQRIHARGGKVVLLRMPTDKQIWEIDERRYPKEVYWDRLAAYTSARAIHFRDYPQLSKYSLPDGSHLDYRDAIPFTRSLAGLIFDQAATWRRGGASEAYVN